MKFLAATVVMLATTMVASAVELRVDGLDTERSIEENLDQLNGLTEISSERVPKGWSGTTRDGLFVILGETEGLVSYAAVSREGSFGANDRASLRDVEEFFGLDGAEGALGDCGTTNTDPQVECVAAFYGCPHLPPTCQVTILSWGGGGAAGVTRAAWSKDPVSIVD